MLYQLPGDIKTPGPRIEVSGADARTQDRLSQPQGSRWEVEGGFLNQLPWTAMKLSMDAAGSRSLCATVLT